ncbi:MAG TPA: hypothetical protein VEX36_04950 [Thermoleophilaceae bacterium]|nr:hypothetical protein [Thermoleophilaceae bacterium]
MDPLTCSLAMLVTAALGGGADTRALPVTVQDDAIMLHRPPNQVTAAARRMATLGVDRVRLTAGWSALAPDMHSRRAPDFGARRSERYPREPWSRLDRAVKAVTTAGLEPQIDIAFFAPRWATKRGDRRSRYRWEPDPARFGAFAEAVADRYDGTHRDPARSAQRKLPAVRLWTTWNEPNHASFLLPQWRRVEGRWTAHSPHLYRKLHEAAYASIKRVSPDNEVLIGGLAALGTNARGPRKGIPPLRFLRELACVDRRGRPLERAACADFKPLRADGLAHHPYSLYDRPDAESVHPEHVTIGDMPRLSRMLEWLHRAGRITTRLPIYITEYGYETNPPDRGRGVSLLAQARYHGLATFLAWKRQDVSSFAQFLLNDNSRTSDWNSGLYFHDGRAKPAVQAFKVPFWAEYASVAGRDVVLLFGQVRPGQGRKRIEVELRGADGEWHAVKTYETRTEGDYDCGEDSTPFLTDAEGFFLRVVPYFGRARYRARWVRNSGASQYTVPIPVRQPPTGP